MVTRYSVRGRGRTGTNEEVFYGIDSQSGGYPYIATNSGAETDDIKQAIEWLEKCGDIGIIYPEVVRVSYEVVDVTEYIETKANVSNIVDNMTDNEKEFARRMLGV